MKERALLQVLEASRRIGRARTIDAWITAMLAEISVTAGAVEARVVVRAEAGDRLYAGAWPAPFSSAWPAFQFVAQTIAPLLAGPPGVAVVPVSSLPAGFFGARVRHVVVALLGARDRRLGAVVLGVNGADPAAGTLEFVRLLALQAEVNLEGVLRLDRQEREIAYLHEHDDLVTKLPNRVRFRRRLRQALEQRTGVGELAVLFADLDGFHQINQRYGYDAGDAVLREVGCRWQEVLQVAEPDAELARMGGDEFAVLLVGAAGERCALDLARSMLAAVKGPLVLPGVACRLTASLGVARSTDGLRTVEAILRAAESAMNEAKRRGPGGWWEHRPAARVNIRPARD